MYIEKKKIKGKEYYYARVSVRSGNTVKSKTLAYLGLGTMTKKELKKAVARIPKEKISAVGEERNRGAPLQQKYLTARQIDQISEINNRFGKKIMYLDKTLLHDMFKDFKTHYIYNTNAIEGNTINFKETNLLLNANKTPAHKDLREVYDHLNASAVFDFLLKYKPEITKEIILQIHGMLLNNIDVRKEAFRLHNVRVIGSHFETTDAKYVETDMKLLLEWYKKNKKNLHPLVLAALFHEKFERIHPFYDGNGRTGRMLLHLTLLHAQLPPLIILNKDRINYYEALDAGHKAELFHTNSVHYKDIVDFCYKQLMKTWDEIFAKWG
ncbi:MAG: Fic family protein [Nanoarchaeota archaeon]